MKRLLSLLMLTALLVSPALADGESPRDSARSCLTEVYGYTPQEADSFEFQDDGKGMLRYWPKDHPEWVYTHPYATSGGEAAPGNAESPFYNGRFYGFPGESAIRDMLRVADQKGWFRQWDRQAIQDFNQALQDSGAFRPTASLAAGLASGTLTAAQAVEEFFRSCLGEPHLWTPAARQWRDAVLKEAGLAPAAPFSLPEGLPITVQGRGGESVTITQFVETVPEAIRGLFGHPRLAGFTCLGGVIREVKDTLSLVAGSGIAAFEKEGQRLLVMFLRDRNMSWQLFPVSETALRKNLPIALSMDDDYLKTRISCQISSDETEIFTVSPDTRENQPPLCQINSYQRVNHKTGEALKADNGPRGWFITETLKDGMQAQATALLAVPGYMEAITDIDAFPTTGDAWFNIGERLIPEGCAMLMGVHLRQKTSSRSASLGDFNPGTLDRVLGYEKGDPHPWLHAQIGLKTGYASSAYVNPPESEFGNASSFTRLLPVAKTRKALALKNGTGLFGATVKELPQGAKMHVLYEEGGWLYVVVPRGEIGWLMDVEGSYGFVRAEDVVTASSALQLDWLE